MARKPKPKRIWVDETKPVWLIDMVKERPSDVPAGPRTPEGVYVLVRHGRAYLKGKVYAYHVSRVSLSPPPAPLPQPRTAAEMMKISEHQRREYKELLEYHGYLERPDELSLN